jgi:2-dehydro-3-deoxygluconokinase
MLLTDRQPSATIETIKPSLTPAGPVCRRGRDPQQVTPVAGARQQSGRCRITPLRVDEPRQRPQGGRASIEESTMRSGIVTVGETMALLGTPDHCLLRPGSAPSLTIGGAESNVAIAAGRLGARTTWIGRVGDDDLGSLVVRELRAQGVHVHAHRDPAAPTGLMVKEHRLGTPTHVRYYRKHSAGSHLAPDDLDRDALAHADILHLTGITAALGDTARAALRHAIAVARGGGATISFDVNYRATLWPRAAAAPVLRELASAADILFAGPDEAALLLPGGPYATDADDPWGTATALAQRVCDLGPRIAVIKLGSLGALALADGTVHTHPIVPIEPVDPVGAGDSFVGAFLAEFANSSPIETCLKSAAKMGALVCAVPGDWEGALDWGNDSANDADSEVRR